MIALLLACAGDLGLPDHFYMDAGGDPVISPDGTIYGHWQVSLNPADGSRLIASRLWSSDELAEVGGRALVPPVVAPDGFVLSGEDRHLAVLTDRLHPWARLPVGGDARYTVPAVAADGRTFLADAVGVVSAFDIDAALLWRVYVPGTFTGRASLDGDARVLLLLGTTPDGHGRYVGLDTATGELLWEWIVDVPWGPVHVAPDGTAYTVTYAGDPNAGDRELDAYRIVAFDPADGAVLWEVDAGGFPLSPSITGNGDLVTPINTLDASYGALVRLRARDGREIWREDAWGNYGRPTLTNRGTILVGCGTQLCEFDAGSGAAVREYDTGGYFVAFAPAAMDGVVVANSDGVVVGWDTGSDLSTAREGWPRYGGANHGAGRAP